MIGAFHEYDGLCVLKGLNACTLYVGVRKPLSYTVLNLAGRDTKTFYCSTQGRMCVCVCVFCCNTEG